MKKNIGDEIKLVKESEGEFNADDEGKGDLF